jgi:prepilin-type N-terminal cleavage/methylation domain-containing protein
MISLKKRQSGFTIVELLIVIVIIGILATLVIVTFTGTQKKARDSQRQTDINAVASHLEAYYADKGYYPTFTDLSDTATSGFVRTELKGLDTEALVGPKGGALKTGAASGDQYGYNVTCTDSADRTTCTGFELQAILEKDGSTYSKKSNT